MNNSKNLKRAADDSSDESTSSAGSSGFSYKNFRPRKKSTQRRHDAGRRYQRGRLYDSATGITCHFCRQKVVHKHVYCRKCAIAYCTNCLRNRHGEDIEIETTNDDDNWLCPKCRGGCGPGCKNCCNCTFCRKKQGLKPPKVSVGEMRAHGFDNVHDYLIHLETGESPECISARKAGKGWCRSYEERHSRAFQSSQVHEQREKETSKGSEEVASSAANMHQKVNDAVIEKAIRKVEEKVKGSSKAQGPPPPIRRGSFSSQFSSKNCFKEKLEARLAEAFDAQELKDLWEAVKCRKPLSMVSETPQGTANFTTKELGPSYIHRHPDLARELTATGEQEVKLRLLRGFFFWLEHVSMVGSFKPWIANDKDAECVELDGPDCELLGVLLHVDRDKQTSNSMCHAEIQEDTEPQIKRDYVGEMSSPAKPIFNWDAEDIKPKCREDLLKISSFKPQIHVKEELDDS